MLLIRTFRNSCMFMKKPSSHVLIVSRINTDGKGNSKRFLFYSKNSNKQLINKIKDYLTKKNIEGNTKYKILIKDNISGKSKSFNMNISSELNSLCSELGKEICSSINIYDLRKTKYSINVSNNESISSDIKMISFHNKENLNIVFENLKAKLKKISDMIAQEQITFTDYKPTNRSTHYVILHKNKKTKSLSLFLPDYSSLEIIELIQQPLKENEDE